MYVSQSPKFKRVSLDKTLEFPFWSLNILDFDLRDSKKIENINKLNKIIFHNKNIVIHKTGIRETRVLKLVFRTILRLKFLDPGK